MFQPNNQTDLDEQDERVRIRNQEIDMMKMMEKQELIDQGKREKSRPFDKCKRCRKLFNEDSLILFNKLKYCKGCYSKAVMDDLERRYLSNGDENI